MLLPCVKNSYSSFKAHLLPLAHFLKEVLGRGNQFLFCDVPVLCIFADDGHHAAVHLMSFSPSTLVLLEAWD